MLKFIVILVYEFDRYKKIFDTSLINRKKISIKTAD